MDQDNALLIVREQDIRKRVAGGQQLIEFLSNDHGRLLWTNVDKITDSLAAFWVSSSNFKVALLGLDILSLLLEKLQTDFQHHYHLVHNALVDRLGDQKDQVRDASITLLTNIMDAAASPQMIFEKLASAFSHKVWRVREGVCRLLVATINRFGPKCLYLSRLVPVICKLLLDSNVQVRDAAASTLVEIYRHVGEKVRQDLSKLGIPPAKLNALHQQFDLVRNSGDMASESGSLASSVASSDSFNFSGPIQHHSTTNNNTHHSRVTVADHAPTNYAAPPEPSRSSSAHIRRSAVPPVSAGRASQANAGGRSNAGGVDEDSFVHDFTANLPTARVYSGKDLDEQMSKIQAVLSDQRKDWEDRTKALKQLRALIVAGGTEYDTFYNLLRVMEPALQLNAKDLRSQVVRETCVTIGLLASTIKSQFDHSAVMLLPTLFALIPSAAKVMATSGILSIRTILKYTHGVRIVPIVTSYCSSKSTSIRKHTVVFLSIMLQNWPPNVLERHMQSLKDAVHKGIGDADAETREEARRAWHSLQQSFPAEADDVFSKLNANQQKLIKGSVPSASSSTDSLHKPAEASRKSSASSLMQAPSNSGPRRSTVMQQRGPSRASTLQAPTSNYSFSRSRSDIDPQSARRSKAKAAVVSSGYGTIGRVPARVARQRTPSAIVAPHQGKNSAPQERGRNSDRPSASQPGSRSNSPGGNHLNHTIGRPSYHSSSSNKPPTYGSSSAKNPRSPTEKPSSASRRTVSGTPLRVLPKGKEGEQVLNDALSRKVRRNDNYGLSDNDDDFSDTSSVCSDRSTSYSRNGLKKRPQNYSEDVAEILQLCQSNLWTERKDGLVGLQALILKQTNFEPLQMKKILEIFNRLFADPHGKVFSMFLEMLPDFIATYTDHLHDWLYVVMTQLLKKMGADMLGSVQSKVMKALQVTRESFPTQLQFTILSRYIVDQTQKPSLKVKIALLHYFLDLTALMRSAEIRNNADTRLAVSRIIAWNTEPRSADIRKISEALVIAIFNLNAPVFTMMIRVLPKTFQDGAMKILHGYIQANGDTGGNNSTTECDGTNGGQFVGRVALSPTRNVSEGGGVATCDFVSPRWQGNLSSSENNNMDLTCEENNAEMTENFADIAADIQKLRLDSSVDDEHQRRDSSSADEYSSSPTRTSSGAFRGSPTTRQPPTVPSPAVGSPTRTGVTASSPYAQQIMQHQRPQHPPPLQQLQNSPNVSSGGFGSAKLPSKYTPSAYAEKQSARHHQQHVAVRRGGDVTKSELDADLLRAQNNAGADIGRAARSLSTGTERETALADVLAALQDNSDGMASQQRQNQWDLHFNSILFGVLEVVRCGDAHLKLTALLTLNEMLKQLSHRFRNFVEITVNHLLQVHKENNKDVVRAAEQAAHAMCAAIHSPLLIRVLAPMMKSDDCEVTQACLKTLTVSINRCEAGELNQATVDGLIPGLLQCYDSEQSGIRKAAVFCLVALHRVIGDAELSHRLQHLSGGKMKLLQLYIKRSQGTHDEI